MIKDFASLHGHSYFSVFDGLSSPEENIKAAKEKGLKAIALTDHGVCHGHADHYLAGKKHGVKAIFGVEAYLIHSLSEWQELKEKLDAAKKKKNKNATAADMDEADGLLGEQDSKALRRKGHLVILACNREGLANLYQLVYKSFRDGFYGKPRMDKDMLRAHAKGLVASSACMGGVVSKRCWDWKDGRATWDDVVREAKEYDEIFGRGRFYLELQLNEHEGQKFINECMVRIHRETGIPLTVTTDFHYSKQEEWEAREILHMLDWDQTIKDMPAGRVDAEIKQLYVKSADEMFESLQKFGSDIDVGLAMQAFENTLRIACDLVEDFEPDTHQRLPTLPYENPFKELGDRAIAGLKKLGLDKDERYVKRLLYELKVIKDKGFSNYFLTLGRVIDEARKRMLLGAGRGSAAASLVCWATGLTDLDPVELDLMFERFLDPDRYELPDIDTDFQDVDAAKDIMREMFGEDNVACLSTYNTFQIKGLLKDVGRVFCVDHNEINRVNKKIESELRVLYHGQDKSTIVIKLEDIERVSPTFNAFVEQYPQVGVHLKTLYGRVRHVGRHAAGVIIGDNLPAETALWVQKDKDTGKKIVHASFTEGIVNKNISAMGFVKFDILSIATLNVIDHCLRLISKRTGREYAELAESIRAHNMDLNDMRVMKHVFWEGRYAGIFQFTEKGIRRLGMNVKPTTFSDIAAITALYRPGPLGGGYDKIFTECKHNPELIKYDHPLLESILKRTNGCVVFQEQLMQICNVLGKMSMKDVNRVRKVLLKKDKSKTEEFLKKENEELSGKFFQGCAENGMEKGAAKELWEKLLKFGGYGFNAAHSYAYSVMTMQTAHLATYYPLEFYAAVLTCAQSGDIQGYISDIRRCGIEVLPVDVNKSGPSHRIEGKSIRLSFKSVLGVGPAAIAKVVDAQPYSSFLDFLDRSGVSKTTVEPLILVGAFDSLNKNMKQLQHVYDYYVAHPEFKKKKGRDEWVRWYDQAMAVPDFKDYELHEKVFLENQLLGFSVRGSPFEILNRAEKIERIFGDAVVDYKTFIEGDENVAMMPVACVEVKERAQRNGQMMAFLKFQTMSGEEFEAPAFSGIWRHVSSRLRRGGVYVAIFNRSDDEPTALKLGKPGFGHSALSAAESVVNIDEVQL